MTEGYSIEALVADLRRITAKTSDEREILAEAAPLVRRLADDTSWVDPSFYDADEEQGFAINILHEDSDHSLLVEAIAWLPGRGVAPHDHRTWGVVVGIDGPETNVNWERLDDGSRPGHADIRPRHEVVVGPGDVCVFMPRDIHSVRNESDQTTLSLHVYGRSLAHIDRSQFDPEAKTEVPCPKRARRAA